MTNAESGMTNAESGMTNAESGMTNAESGMTRYISLLQSCHGFHSFQRLKAFEPAGRKPCARSCAKSCALPDFKNRHATRWANIFDTLWHYPLKA